MILRTKKGALQAEYGMCARAFFLRDNLIHWCYLKQYSFSSLNIKLQKIKIEFIPQAFSQECVGYRFHPSA